MPCLKLILSSTANNCRGLLYHIQYFSDTPERGYVAGKNLVIFSEKEQYQTLCRGTKQSTLHSDGKKVLILFTHSLLNRVLILSLTAALKHQYALGAEMH